MMRRFVLCALACVCAYAQTQIRDTIYTGTGAQYRGRVVIISPDMRTSSGRTIVRARTELQISDGQIAVDLEPNDSATPANTFYVVQYFPRGGQSWSEQWIVPTSATPLTVADVRVISSGGQWPVPPPQYQLPNYADSEVPVGPIDGNNRTYELAHSPAPAPSLILTRNGPVLRRGVDYSLSGKTITFILEQTPVPGDILLAWYRY